VFPTRVGVNRVLPFPLPVPRSVPHASGGEPHYRKTIRRCTRVPHASGGEPIR